MYNVERVQIVNGAGDVVHHAAGVTFRVLGRSRDRFKQVTALQLASATNIQSISVSGVATGVRWCGPHRAALARGSKGAKNAENLKKTFT